MLDSTAIAMSATCPACNESFKARSNKTYCSPRCRKSASQKQRCSTSPVNAANSRTERRKQHEIYDTALRLAEMLYTMPTTDRLGFTENLVQLARSGGSSQLRSILTNPSMIRPNPRHLHLFYRSQPKHHCTISQAANRYCLASPWNDGVANLVRGITPVPSTGEIV